MKTLVIHPTDYTTNFLKGIYADTDWTIINDNPSNKALKNAIKSHDRIVMLGHGTEHGLIGHKRLIIDSGLVYLLKGKPGSVYIWCNADVFVKKYDLKGFYTGMIISEIEEAYLYCVNFRTSADIDDSNKLFADSIKNAICLDSKEMCTKVKENYVSLDNNIIHFNAQNIYEST